MPEFKACPPEKAYYQMEVVEGKTYAWCACGLSDRPPFCDGSHAGTEKRPVFHIPEKTKDVFFCGCKKTKNPPFCDGSHKSL